MESSVSRPCHARSNSSPVPSAEPWGEYISPSPSLIMNPCSHADLSCVCGAAQCGLGEALEGFMFPDDDGGFLQGGGSGGGGQGNDHNRALEGLDIDTVTAAPPMEDSTLPLTANHKNTSSDSLYLQQQQQQGRARNESPPPSPPSPESGEGGGYQKRGRFLVWPVHMAPPSMTFPFLGLTPQ